MVVFERAAGIFNIFPQISLVGRPGTFPIPLQPANNKVCVKGRRTFLSANTKIINVNMIKKGQVAEL